MFYRRNKSTFTRVQRLACCFVLIFLAMVVNAMWYVHYVINHHGDTLYVIVKTVDLKCEPILVSRIVCWSSVVLAMVRS